MRQSGRQPNAWCKIFPIWRRYRVHVAQRGRIRQSRIIQIQEIPAVLAKRREVLIAEPSGYADPWSDPPIVLNVSCVAILTEISLGRSHLALRLVRKAKQEIGKGIAGRVRVRRVL